MENSEQTSTSPVYSKRYMIFLVAVMGLVSQMDSWLSLIETKAVPGILDEFWPGIVEATARSEFALLQGIFGIIVFGVFFIAWYADAYGRRSGMFVLVLVMGIPAILIVFLSISIYMFLLILGTYFIDSYGWRWGYGSMFFLMLLLMVLLYFMKDPQRWKDTLEARERARLGIMDALRKLRREDRKYILIATIVYLTWTIAFKMATTFGGEYFTGVLAYSDSEFNSILTIAGLLLPVSALVSGLMLDKIGRNFVLVLGSLGSVATLIGLGLTGTPIFYQAAYFFMAMVLAWIYVYLAEIFTTEVRSTSIGVCVTGARLGYVVGPLLSAALTAMFPIMDGFWIFAGVLMLIPLVTLLTKPLETKGKTLEEIEVER
ncbi:MAG: MFS transporter [Candidatus Thorarchaeota archaeon]|jgi:MFS family permease